MDENSWPDAIAVTSVVHGTVDCKASDGSKIISLDPAKEPAPSTIAVLLADWFRENRESGEHNRLGRAAQNLFNALAAAPALFYMNIRYE